MPQVAVEYEAVYGGECLQFTLGWDLGMRHAEDPTVTHRTRAVAGCAGVLNLGGCSSGGRYDLFGLGARHLAFRLAVAILPRDPAVVLLRR